MSLSLTFSSVESVRLLTAPPSFDSLYLLSLGYDAIKERKSQKRKEKDADGGRWREQMVRLLTREPCVWRATAATAGPKHMEEMMTPSCDGHDL